jgi:hypothetical protein
MIQNEINDAINEQIFEFAHVVKELIDRGWTFGEIKYNERRLGIGPSMIISKNGKTVRCCCGADIEAELNKEIEEELRAKN